MAVYLVHYYLLPIFEPTTKCYLRYALHPKRPMVDENDNIVVFIMMYLALSYDHRIVDGKGAVTFLKND